MRVTEKQKLLQSLHTSGGYIQGRDVTAAMKKLASEMVLPGLVRWQRPEEIELQPNRDNWRLCITDKGRAAIRVDA